MTAENNFLAYGEGLTSPIRHAFAITPSDVEELPFVTRSIHVNVGGDVKVTTLGGETVTYTLLAGSVKDGMFKQVHATDTTATNLIGEY